jgi:ligand-binding sensor domain-containing protein
MGQVNGREYFWDEDFGDLLTLSLPTDPAGKIHLGVARVGRHLPPSEIYDAFIEGDGAVLLSTATGLIRFTLQDGKIQRIPHPRHGEEIESLCRDRQGRLWAAGQGIYISTDEGKHWAQVKLPMQSPTYTKRVRANPANERGIIVAMYDRGAVFIDW